MSEPETDLSEPQPLSLENPPTDEGSYQGKLHDPRDEACNFEILPNFERFNKNNDIYNRGRWDERIMSKKVIDWFKIKYFKFWVWLAGTRLRRLALWLDYKIGDRGRKEPKWWWDGGGDKTLNK